jgi:hypothetical protein
MQVDTKTSLRYLKWQASHYFTAKTADPTWMKGKSVLNATKKNQRQTKKRIVGKASTIRPKPTWYASAKAVFGAQ